jgi:putative transposase
VDLKDDTAPLAAKRHDVSKRRIRQLTSQYRKTGEFPTLNPNRRPKGPPLTEDQKAVIDAFWEEKRLGATLLWKELKKAGFHIPHNKVNTYLKDTGKTIPNPKKQKKRKRCRYERNHSFSLVHGDWHRTTENHPHAIIWLDDASRYAIGGGEFSNATAEHSISTFQQAQDIVDNEYCTKIREVNTDRGVQFYSNHPNSVSKFEQYLIDQMIVFVPSGKQNPQTNGKLERLWLEYDRHRWRFDTIYQFLDWYNDRIHGALWSEIGETPGEAVVRKLQPEAILGLFLRGISK